MAYPTFTPPFYSASTAVPTPPPNLGFSHGCTPPFYSSFTPPFYSTFTNIPLQSPNPYTSYVSSSNPYTYGSSASAGSLGYYNSIHPYSQPIGYQNSSNSYASQETRRSEMAISVFDGTEDAYWWVLCTEKYFNARETSETKKMAETATTMRGPTLKWWLWWSQRHPLASWDSFTTAFLWRFKPEFWDVLPTPDEAQEPNSELMSSVLTASEAVLLPTDQIELASLTDDLVERLGTVAPLFGVYGTTPQTEVQHPKWSTEAITSSEQQRSFHTMVRVKKPTIPSPTPPPPKPPDSVLVTPSSPLAPPQPPDQIGNGLVSVTTTQTRFSPSDPHDFCNVNSHRVKHFQPTEVRHMSPSVSCALANALVSPSILQDFRRQLSLTSLNSNAQAVPFPQSFDFLCEMRSPPSKSTICVLPRDWPDNPHTNPHALSPALHSVRQLSSLGGIFVPSFNHPAAQRILFQAGLTYVRVLSHTFSCMRPVNATDGYTRSQSLTIQNTAVPHAFMQTRPVNAKAMASTHLLIDVVPDKMAVVYAFSTLSHSREQIFVVAESTNEATFVVEPTRFVFNFNGMTHTSISLREWDYVKGTDQLFTKVHLLCRFDHRSLMGLIGCCEELEQTNLVYEFTENGNLLDHLQDSLVKRCVLLIWNHCLLIKLDTVDGLAYFLFVVVPPIHHNDVKPNNTLLDMSFGKFNLSLTWWADIDFDLVNIACHLASLIVELYKSICRGDIQPKLFHQTQRQLVFIFSVRIKRGQQWDPGGYFGMSKAVQSSQFKQWDPGKFIQGSNFYNLEDKVGLNGVGNVRNNTMGSSRLNETASPAQNDGKPTLSISHCKNGILDPSNDW